MCRVVNFLNAFGITHLGEISERIPLSKRNTASHQEPVAVRVCHVVLQEVSEKTFIHLAITPCEVSRNVSLCLHFVTRFIKNTV